MSGAKCYILHMLVPVLRGITLARILAFHVVS